MNGFKLWNIEDERFQNFHLPNGVRNITKKFNQSSNIIISKDDKLAVTGIRSIHLLPTDKNSQNQIKSSHRQELLCWDMKTGDLVKRMVAHFQVFSFFLVVVPSVIQFPIPILSIRR